MGYNLYVQIHTYIYVYIYPHCRLVPNPVKVLAEIKSNGENIETVGGKIVAGDSGDINVVKIKGNDRILEYPKTINAFSQFPDQSESVIIYLEF